MKKKVLLLMMAALPLMAVAQQSRHGNNGNHGGYGNGGYGNGYNNNNGGRGNYQPIGVPGSALTIWSESGERFFLILNGIKQNMYAQSKVRIEGLPQVINDIQIIFDDNRTAAISKTISFMDPVEGQPISLSMRITRDRNGYARLAFNRMSTLERDYRGEQGEYVMMYGHDAPRQVPTVPTPPPPPPAPVAMDNVSFGDALRTIKSSSWDDTKLSTAKTIANTNYFTTDQIMTICKLFSWDDSKLDFAKFAYTRCVDYNNYYKVATVFSWESNRKALNDYINSHR